MLIISGSAYCASVADGTNMFQSRNRDAYHFRSTCRLDNSSCPTFQSRNRDAYHFRTHRATAAALPERKVSISQSRCLSFQGYRSRVTCTPACFNLAIEMLIISGKTLPLLVRLYWRVSISQSRCLSFQVPNHTPTGGRHRSSCFNLAIEMLIISGKCEQPVIMQNNVSISQSRCLSFQV